MYMFRGSNAGVTFERSQWQAYVGGPPGVPCQQGRTADPAEAAANPGRGLIEGQLAFAGCDVKVHGSDKSPRPERRAVQLSAN